MNLFSKSVGAGCLTLSGFFCDEIYSQDFSAVDIPSPTPVVSKESSAAVVNEISALINNPDFSSLEQGQRDHAFSIYLSLDSTSRKLFVELLSRTAVGKDSPLVLEKDFLGGTMLQTLDRICHSDFHTALQSRRGEILESLFFEISRPGTLNQGYRGVCGTSMAYGLYMIHPAEAARLVGGLLTPEGEVRMLKPGTTLKRAPYSLVTDDLYGRSITEHLLLSALMDYGNGVGHGYCDLCDVNFHLSSGVSDTGLACESQAQIYKALYNLSDKQCVVIDMRGKAFPPWLEKDYLPGYIPIAMQWSYSSNPYKNGSFHRAAEGGSHTLITNTGHGLPQVTGTGVHMVTLLRIENGRAYFHNMQGASGHSNGAVLQNPPRRIEDNERGIQSMELKEFKKRVLDIIIPRVGSPTPKPN